MFTRILRLSAVLCLCTVWHVATARAQFCVPPPSGIVSWWPANGDAIDFYGLNSGTLQGGALANAPGEVSTAFQFDGTNGFVQIPNSAALEPTNLTVEAWVLFNSLNSTENSAPGQQYIVFKQNSRSGNFEGYDLGKQRSGGSDHFYFQVASSSGTEIEVNSTNPISTGVWYHVAGVRGSNYIQLYVNGRLQGQVTVSFPQDYGHLPLYFGTTGQSYWDGKLAGELDEVSLYNRPLSSNEIYGIYQAGAAGKCQEAPMCTPPPSGLVSWWKAEDNGNDSYNTNNGTLVGGANFAPGAVGQAFSLNGTSQYVDVPNSPSLNPPTGLTLEAWIYPTQFPGSAPIITKAGEGSAQQDGYTLEINSGNLIFGAYVGGTWLGAGTVPMQLNQWSHVAAEYDGTNEFLYLNAVLVGWRMNVPGGITPSGNDLQIGHDPSNQGNYFAGLIDEVGLYSNALSAAQIQAIYAAGSAGKCGEPPVITSKPQNQTVTAGSSVSFTVSAVGFQPLAYQWQLNGTNISAASNPSATNSTLLLTNVQPAQSGNISALVSNPYGSTNSAAATLNAYVPVCVPPPTGLVGWWAAEGDATDSFGTNDGTLEGGVTFTGGEVDQAFTFNGINQYVMVPNAPGLNVTNQFTIDCWINRAPINSSTPAYEGIVIADYYGIEWAPGTSGFYVYMSANSGSSYFQTGQANPGNMTFPAGQWHHLAATYDGTKLQMYLDGQAWGNPAPASGNVSPIGAPDFLTLGGENGRACGCGGRNFNGLLDEVDLFNRALSPAEIQAIYNAGSAGKCAGPMITLQPQSQNAVAGGTAIFNVSAEGRRPFSYQWQANGVNIESSGNSTVTNSTLVLTNLPASQSGSLYSVVVANAFGSTQSSNATLTVYQPVTRYVAAGNAGAAAPYTNWSTAASNIQDAIDAATNGDLILVTNGVYQAGGRVVPPFFLTNRIVINKPVTVQSVNGPSMTAIQGYQGDGAVRCAYLTNGASLIGFTLNNGATRVGGDSYHEQNGGGVWAESTNAIVSNCVFVGNAACNSGGGIFNATVENCALAANQAVYSGGAASGSILNGCLLTNNSVVGFALQSGISMGGAAVNAVLNNCTIAGNYVPDFGGGAASCTLNDCVVEGNTGDDGGGAYSCTLNGCAVFGNFAKYGGGAYSSTLNNCTLTGNDSIWSGGVYGSTANNSIVYYNIASTNANFDATDKLNFCCTTPAVPSGAGNITNEPQLATIFHLSQNSPCRGAGNPSYAAGTDINGNAWQNPPSIGCDEYMAAGPLTVSIQPGYAMASPGFALSLAAEITGRPGSSVWDFGDGTTLTNRPYASHAWNTPGDYVVVLTAYNNDNPGGISASMVVHIATSAVLYVDQHGTNPVPPFSSWSTAATNIQDAVDACSVPGAVIWVTNGLYNAGGHASPPYGLVNRVMITQPIALQSVNGPAVTVIEGSQVTGTGYGLGAIRCVYLANGATLAGFTLTNGATLAQFTAFTAFDLTNEQTGAGIFSATSNTVISNCVLVSNIAYGMGGGAYQGTFVNCSFVGNSSAYGGGAVECVLTNCLITSNVAVYQYQQLLSCGGGAAQCTLQNCTLTSNSVSLLQGSFAKGGGAYQSILTSCLIASNSGLSGAGAGWLCKLTNCMLIANYGGPASIESTLNHCTLAYNTNGASGEDTLNYCTIVSNTGGGASDGTLNFCSLIANTTSYAGGGAYDCTLNNCLLAGNAATNIGGGTIGGVLNDCTLTGNFAGSQGGAAYESVMTNCTIVGNSAGLQSGGVFSATHLANCIVYSNTAPVEANYAGGTLNNCCTIPLPPGLGNITNEPAFVNLAIGDYHLQPNSPCINSGNNAYVSTTNDLDGNPRISGGTVDIGAYEFQNPASIISYAWLQQYGLPTDGSADFADPDHDGMNNYSEWLAGTDPTNPLSVLELLPPIATNNPPGAIITWQSQPNISYFLQRATNFSVAPAFQPLATNLPGQPGTTSYTDTNAPAPGPYYYRVGIQH